MSLRSVWVVSIVWNEREERQIARTLFARVFPTVEKRAKIFEGDHHVQLPESQCFTEGLQTAIGFKGRSQKFVPSRDSCKTLDQKPVFEVNTTFGKLWPVLVIEQNGLLFCCLPLVEESSHTKPPLIKIRGLSTGFSLLLGMAEFLGELPAAVDEIHPKLAELYYFVNQAAPFGTPIDVNPATVRALMTKTAMATADRQPTWKPVLHKGKQSLSFAVSEQIRAIQYDNALTPDVWDVYGTVTCHAELEGTMPEVTINLASSSAKPLPLESIMVHSSVQSCDADCGPNQPMKTPCKLRYTPPNEMILLCNYCAKLDHQALPIRGFYQMKGESTVDVLVQMKLNDGIKNSFSHLSVHVPFFNRGPVVKHEGLASQGSIQVSQTDSRILVWNVGQKFPSKNLEVMLKATVHFDPAHYGKKMPHVYEDPLCMGNNAYVQVFFKIADFSLTGCIIDTKTIQVSPRCKYKLNTSTETCTSDYKIWNTHGDSTGYPAIK